MKFTFNKYWMFVAVCIVVNILIFTVMSNKLESYVAKSIIEKSIYYE